MVRCDVKLNEHINFIIIMFNLDMHVTSTEQNKTEKNACIQKPIELSRQI